MNRSVALSGLLLLAFVISGCASDGNETLRHETETSVQGKIVEGKTTKVEIKSMFGSPIRTTFTDGGLEMWTYEFSKISMDAVTLISVFVPVGTSASGTRKELVILFDTDNVTKRFVMSESAVKETTGLFSR